MKKRNVLILGASGQIASHVIDFLKKDESIHMTLFARNTGEIVVPESSNITKITGDVLSQDDLNNAIEGQDIVYANLAGSLDKMAEQIVDAMGKKNVDRLLFVTSLGIYNEIPGKFGEWNDRMIGNALKTYRKAADIIEASKLNYTIIRPAWLTDKDEVDYETTQKGEDFKGTEVSRKSVGAFITELIKNPKKENQASIGINKRGTDGDKPAFY